jgi:hypothetical protein
LPGYGRLARILLSHSHPLGGANEYPEQVSIYA